MSMTHEGIIADIREGSAGILALMEEARNKQNINFFTKSNQEENMVIAEEPEKYTSGPKERIRVMVTGVGGGGNGEQLVKALRMSDKNYFLIGADITPVSKGLFYVDQKRILPPASDPNYIEALLQVCREEGVQALFTGSEPELKKISAVQDEIRAAGIFLPMNPQSVIETCMDKSKTMAFLDENGFARGKEP